VSPVIASFLKTVAGLAQQLGGTPVLIVIRDPGTRQVHFVGTPGAFDNMRSEIAVKVGGEEQPDTGWEG
jgi:hypothetical protein